MPRFDTYTENISPQGSALLVADTGANTERIQLGNLSSFKLPVRVATTANITLSGEQTIDGVSTSTDRVLVKDQTAGEDNGIYVSAAGAWARAADFDASSKAQSSALVLVKEGTAESNTMWQLTTNDPITLDTTSLVFAKFVGSGIANIVEDTTPQLGGDLDANGSNILIDAVGRLYLDGGTHTFIHEVGDDDLRFVVGNVAMFRLDQDTELTSVMIGDFTVPATGKIFLDNGGDTYIYEDSVDRIAVFVGGSLTAHFRTNGLSIQAVDRLFLDGGGDTYIREVGANKIDMVAGSQVMFEIDQPNTNVNVIASDLSVAATKKLWFDGPGGTSWIEESSDGHISLFVNTAEDRYFRVRAQALKGFRAAAGGTTSTIHDFEFVAKTTVNMDNNMGILQRFYLEDDTSGELEFGRIGIKRGNATDADGRMAFATRSGGSITDALTIFWDDRIEVTDGLDLHIGAADKFYLDSGGDTYIHEQAANKFEVVVGGLASFNITSVRVAATTVPLEQYEASAAGIIRLRHDTNATGEMGQFGWDSDDSASANLTFAKIVGNKTTATAGVENADIEFWTITNGVMTKNAFFDGSNNGRLTMLNDLEMNAKQIEECEHLFFSADETSGIFETGARLRLHITDGGDQFEILSGDVRTNNVFLRVQVDNFESRIFLERQDDTPTDFDRISSIDSREKNSAAEIITYTAIESYILDQTDATEVGYIVFKTFQGGVDTDLFRIGRTATAEVEVMAGHSFTVHPTDRVYFDGGSDTYIHESAANVLDLVVGATTMISSTVTTTTMSGNVDMVAGKILAIDKATPLAPIHVVNEDRGVVAGNLSHTHYVFIGESEDAVVGLASEDEGAHGSGIDMMQVEAGTLTDKWSMIRQSSTSGNSSLEFIYGTNADYSTNSALVKFQTSGQVDIAGDLDVAENIELEATKRLYLDGGTDIFISRPSASLVEVTVDGVNMLGVTPTRILVNQGFIQANFSEFQARLRLKRTDDPPTTIDTVGQIEYLGINDNSQEVIYSDNYTGIGDDTDGTEDGFTFHRIMMNGTMTQMILIEGAGAKVEIRNADLLIPATKKFFLDAGDDTYIQETSANQLAFFAGGVEYFTLLSNRIRFHEVAEVYETAAVPVWRMRYDNNAAGITMGTLQWRSDDADDLDKTFARVKVIKDVATASAEVSTIQGDVMVGGALATLFEVSGTQPSVNVLAADLNIPAGKKLFLDGGDNSYIWQSGPDTIQIFNNAALTMWFSSSNNAVLEATNKLFFDGGSDTYIDESSSDNLRIHVGGTDMMFIDQDTGFVQVKNSDLTIPAAKRFYIDGGGDSYIDESSSNRFRLTVGAKNMFEVRQTANDALLHAGFLEIDTLDFPARLRLRREDATPTANDNIGSIEFLGDTDMPTTQRFASIDGVSVIVTEGSEEGFIRFNVMTAGTLTGKFGVRDDGVNIIATDKFYLDGGGNTYIIETAADTLEMFAGGARGLKLEEIGDEVNVICGKGSALATTATNGFLYIPTQAGVPTGTPTTQTGKVALCFDTTNDDLYVYNGSWKKTTSFT